MATNIDISELDQIANGLADSGRRWHFHIASAQCRLGDGDHDITFVLEDVSNDKVYRAQATQSDVAVGERLARRLHGSEVFDDSSTTQALDELSAEQAALVQRARSLSESQTPWHHHMLFPDCAFNPSPGLWTLQLEAPGSSHTAASTCEPKAALSIIEKLFYAQSTIN
jgi:hypothetical protein